MTFTITRPSPLFDDIPLSQPDETLANLALIEHASLVPGLPHRLAVTCTGYVLAQYTAFIPGAAYRGKIFIPNRRMPWEIQLSGTSHASYYHMTRLLRETAEGQTFECGSHAGVIKAILTYNTRELTEMTCPIQSKPRAVHRKMSALKSER